MSMKLRRVDPRVILIPEERVTARMDHEKAEQFEESVKTIGIDEPIRVFQVGEELWLSDGLHRLMEAIKLGIEKVDVLVKEGTEQDVLFHNLRSGHLRGKHPVSEMRKMIEKAYKEFNIGIEDIVKKTGLTRDYVEKLLIISELTPFCLEVLDQEKIGVGHASALAKIKDPVRQEVVCNQCITYHWTVKQLTEFISEVDRLVSEKVETPAPPPAQGPVMVKCHFCREEYLPSELASVIVCPACNGIMYEAVATARREYQEELKAVSSQPAAAEKQVETS